MPSLWLESGGRGANKGGKWDLKYCVITKPQRTTEPLQNVVKDNELWAQVAAEAHSNLEGRYLDLLSAQMEVHIIGFVSVGATATS